MRNPWSKGPEIGEQPRSPVVERAIATDMARSDECPMIVNGPDAVTKGEAADLNAYFSRHRQTWSIASKAWAAGLHEGYTMGKISEHSTSNSGTLPVSSSSPTGRGKAPDDDASVWSNFVPRWENVLWGAIPGLLVGWYLPFRATRGAAKREAWNSLQKWNSAGHHTSSTPIKSLVGSSATTNTALAPVDNPQTNTTAGVAAIQVAPAKDYATEHLKRVEDMIVSSNRDRRLELHRFRSEIMGQLAVLEDQLKAGFVSQVPPAPPTTPVTPVPASSTPPGPVGVPKPDRRSSAKAFTQAVAPIAPHLDEARLGQVLRSAIEDVLDARLGKVEEGAPLGQTIHRILDEVKQKGEEVAPQDPGSETAEKVVEDFIQQQNPSYNDWYGSLADPFGTTTHEDISSHHQEPSHTATSGRTTTSIGMDSSPRECEDIAGGEDVNPRIKSAKKSKRLSIHKQEEQERRESGEAKRADPASIDTSAQRPSEASSRPGEELDRMSLRIRWRQVRF